MRVALRQCYVVAVLSIYLVSTAGAQLPAVPADAADLGLKRLSAKFVVNGLKASWAPDGKRLAYTEQATVKVLDLESGKIRQIVTPAKDPAFSPSGKWIAYVRGDQAEETVWLIGSDKNGNRQLASGGFPTWSDPRKNALFSFSRRLAT